MDGTATTGTGFPFLPLAAGHRGLALRCLRRFEAGTLLLFCGGVEVGRLALAGAVEPSRTVEVPVGRLPRVALPAELRLATEVAGPDLAPPWEIASADAAFGLLGPPAPVVESLRLDHGVLRGVATEKANGLLEPVLYARVNDAAARAVATEAPAPLAEGGCVFRFAVPLHPADLVEAGLAVDVHMVGLEAPLARFALAPAGGTDTVRVAELEGRLRRLEDAMASGLDASVLAQPFALPTFAHRREPPAPHSTPHCDGSRSRELPPTSRSLHVRPIGPRTTGTMTMEDIASLRRTALALVYAILFAAPGPGTVFA